LRTASESWTVRFRSVSKRFRLQEGSTLREFVPAFVRGRGWSPAFYALKDVSFSIARGETLGIIGRNGSGKSTLLKLIAGITAPTDGEVLVDGRVSPLIELGAGFHPDLTGRENVLLNASILGMTNRESRDRFEEIVDFAELWDFVDTPVKRYSSGMYLRLSFSVAVHSDPNILILDESLAVGDAPFQERCLGRMREFQRQGVTIVLVSHALPLVRTFCPRALLLEGGCIAMDGPSGDVVDRYLALCALPAAATA